ncbi:DUF305 domain-containing protein [Clavibacter phaseoli]|uniref:DUF305 domain-containing protein n=1 Tax=Clavibacter phaseoli TaxID=1734031 RepID=UPI001F35DBE6|nr:DUF305 domain-containing protein [Clavibacter phaseoli]
MSTTRILLAATLATATTLALAGCASDTSSGMSGMDHNSSSSSAPATSAAPADVNDQDVMFVQMMKPHHEQAIEMADMILEKGDISTEVTQLATEIKAAQVPEIEQLDAWISDWGIEESASGMDHSMDGMMSDDDMSALGSATGTEAEKLFLEQMVQHHEGAVEMAQTEIDKGQNPDAMSMATTIVQTQNDEIATMKDLLASS